MARKAYIIGYGQTKCGFFPDRDLRSLIADAYIQALDSSGIEPKEIQQMWLSHYPVTTDMQATAGQVAIEAVGLGSRVGCITIEQACCSGSQAIHDAALSIDAGRYDCILVAGFGKMTDAIGRGTDPFDESGFGNFLSHAGLILTEPGMNDDYYNAYITLEDAAAWDAQQFWAATKQPNSLCYGQPVPTMEELMQIKSTHRGARGCDGASVVILASQDFAKQYTDTLVYIAAVSHKLESSYYAKAADYGYGGDAPRFVSGKMLPSHSVENAWKECFEQAGIGPQDLDFVNPHDNVNDVSYAHLEGMHHPDIPPGRAPKWFTEGESRPGGKLPACTMGSSKFGQPRGAVGINFLIEGYKQLREECEERQVPLKNGFGAAGTSPLRPGFHILRREL